MTYFGDEFRVLGDSAIYRARVVPVFRLFTKRFKGYRYEIVARWPEEQISPMNRVVKRGPLVRNARTSETAEIMAEHWIRAHELRNGYASE
jgi:hypothetical protein